jgi:hypothetical protein
LQFSTICVYSAARSEITTVGDLGFHPVRGLLEPEEVFGLPE